MTRFLLVWDFIVTNSKKAWDFLKKEIPTAWNLFTTKSKEVRDFLKKEISLIPALVNVIGAGLCGGSFMASTILLGAGFLSLGFFLIGVGLWAIVYVAVGLRLVGENEFLVIERFNQFHTVKLEGWCLLCLPGLIDRVAPNGGKGDFKEHEVKLWDATNEIDFKDGVTAAIKAQFWYRVIRGEAKEEIEDNNSVWRWTYSVTDTQAKASEIVIGTMRGLLQSHDSDEAQANLRNFGQEVEKDVQAALYALGIEIVPNKGVILTDIVLPKEIQAVKQEVLISKKKAEAMENVSRGIPSSITKIRTEAEAAGKKLSWDKALDISLQFRKLDVLEKKEGHINFIAPGVDGIVKTLDVSNPNPKP